MSQVAVCMPMFNAEAFIEKTLRSVLAQSFTDFDLIICDDGSSDRSLEIVRSFDDKRIRLLENPSNIGPASTRNRMSDIVFEEGHEFMALMDADDTCDPKRLARQIDLMEHDISIGLCGTAAHIERTGGKWPVAEEPHVMKVNCIFHNPMPTPTAVLRSQTLARTGVTFRPDMVPCADYAFFAELLIDKNVTAAGINEPLFTYMYNPNGVSHADRRVGQIRKDKEIKRRILAGLGVEVDDAWASSFHDIAFGVPETTEIDLLRYMIISLKLVLSNRSMGLFARRDLLNALSLRMRNFQGRNGISTHWLLARYCGEDDPEITQQLGPDHRLHLQYAFDLFRLL